MTYLSGKIQKRRKYSTYVVYTLIFLALVVFWPAIKKHSYKTIEPVAVRYGVTKNSFQVFPEFFTTYITSHKILVSKNTLLESELERVTNELVTKDAQLREQLFVTSVSSSSTLKENLPIVMYPIMQDSTGMYSTILLSKGYKDGVAIGSTVYIRGKKAVCTITEVYDASSLCLLLTATDITTEGVTSSSSIRLTLTGRGGYFLANILRDTPVTVGEIVYMRSNPAVVVGTVREVSQNNQDTSWRVFVESVYNPVTSSIFYVQQ